MHMPLTEVKETAFHWLCVRDKYRLTEFNCCTTKGMKKESELSMHIVLSHSLRW